MISLCMKRTLTVWLWLLGVGFILTTTPSFACSSLEEEDSPVDPVDQALAAAEAAQRAEDLKLAAEAPPIVLDPFNVAEDSMKSLAPTNDQTPPDIGVDAPWPQDEPPLLSFDKPGITIPDEAPPGESELVFEVDAPWPVDEDMGGGGGSTVGGTIHSEPASSGGGGAPHIPPGGGPQPGLFKLVKPGG